MSTHMPDVQSFLLGFCITWYWLNHSSEAQRLIVDRYSNENNKEKANVATCGVLSEIY